MIEVLSIVAAFFELAGLYLLGRRVRLGFLSNLLGGVLWIAYTLISGNAWGLLMVCSVAIVLNVNGFRNWAHVPPTKPGGQNEDTDSNNIVPAPDGLRNND